mmetsp:Transcript_12806/g.39362  ORF Transcript_12806/g.39362 Transcript_12806/m.39362 type:complete len:432 (+) Transcript_12806:279-1574(+)|eukprot:CAMPEP_0198726172 /NCGR_PEP_ID=MMETSP1475-20131203/3314_1 /TAXON_ID= ORGANISM="Unidentified sp., Strain CCMP1999" /NCGR_SAMPLE_ID=MMETSP1475 /ASSEMBLY_ACC=CAM_ASM_001111 /LENGTH=431 /DNA_ID=CAMNT_0044488073 /DNA_START=235 /DNA_END=1530 /DNA_ORIENTATION=+
MGKKSTAAAQNDVKYELLKKKIEELESDQQKSAEEVRADEVHKVSAAEVRAIVGAADIPSDAKIRSLQTKLLQKVGDNRALEYELGRERRRNLLCERELDATKTELAKMTAAKTKLEGLCRELSKQNKHVKEESSAMLMEERAQMMEERAKSKELVKKFDTAMQKINGKLEEQAESRTRQEDEVEALRQKLRDLMTKYEVREEHFGMQMKTKELEYELQEARRREQVELTKQAQARISELLSITEAQNKTEVSLRAQLAEYGEKFDKFQETLDQSNQVFSAYTAEMEKMSKTVKQLQKTNSGLRDENGGLNKKFNAATYQLVTTKSELEDSLRGEKLEREKREKLERLCRSLTSERTTLQKETEAHQRVWQALKRDVDALQDQPDHEVRGQQMWELLRSLVVKEDLQVKPGGQEGSSSVTVAPSVKQLETS